MKPAADFDPLGRRQLALELEQGRKERGMEASASKNPEILERCREIAADLAGLYGEVTIEDVRESLKARGIHFLPGNWMGSIFRGPGWQFVGTTKAFHKGSHRRRVSIWRLAESR